MNANYEIEYKNEVDRHNKLQKLKVKERIRQEKLKQDASTVHALCFFGVVNIIMIIVPMLGNAWMQVSFVGPGISIAHVKASLFRLETDISCETNAVEMLFCKQILKLGVNGVHSLSDVTHMSCAGMTPRACDITSRLWWDSWVILFFFPLAALAQGLGVLFLFYYWNAAPDPSIRQWAMIMLSLSPIMIMAGLAIFWILSPNLEDLARAWNPSSSAGFDAGNLGGFLSFKHIHPFCIGWCMIWASLAFVSCGLNAATMPFCLSKSEKEGDFLDMEEWERDKALMESLMLTTPSFKSDASYGAVSYGGPPPTHNGAASYGGPPPMHHGAYDYGCRGNGEYGTQAPLQPQPYF